MQSELTTPQPVLDEATRSFVRRSLAAGLLEVDDLKKVVVSLMSESDIFDPNRLATGLIGAGILTQWQANKLLAGKSRGFFLGSYRLLRPLGRGGMGVVYLGEHHVMKRLMALKILPPEASQDQTRIQRFKDEARACAQLDHPNIVRAYDFAEAGRKLYIVMEYVDGIDLHYAIQRDGPMAIGDAIDALTQAATGLAHAHERGIIHRDVKPSNLLLRTDGVVKVSDLGLARIGWPTNEEQKRLMGTADFLAPEQAINNLAADTRSDIYSLGCTLFYLLTGKTPFTGSTPQKLAKHQTAAIPNVRSLRPDCPATVAELVQRMMAKRPEDRPRSAGDLLMQLQRLASANQATSGHLSDVAPAGDTVDDAFYQATIDDSSLSSDGEVQIAEEVAEFDFGDLPPVVPNSGTSVLGPTTPVQPPARPQTVAPATNQPSSANSNQQVLLGAGLAIAILALVAVIGMGIVNMSKPLPTESPRIKATEDGKVVVRIRD